MDTDTATKTYTEMGMDTGTGTDTDIAADLFFEYPSSVRDGLAILRFLLYFSASFGATSDLVTKDGWIGEGSRRNIFY